MTSDVRKKWVGGRTGPIQSLGKWNISLVEVECFLGDPHFVENDPSRTHSGTERFWAFELSASVALAFRFHDLIEELYVGSNAAVDDIGAIIADFIPIEFVESSGLLWD